MNLALAQTLIKLFCVPDLVQEKIPHTKCYCIKTFFFTEPQFYRNLLKKKRKKNNVANGILEDLFTTLKKRKRLNLFFVCA